MSDVHEARAREEDLRSAMLAGDASAPSDLIVETPHIANVRLHKENGTNATSRPGSSLAFWRS